VVRTFLSNAILPETNRLHPSSWRREAGPFGPLKRKIWYIRGWGRNLTRNSPKTYCLICRRLGEGGPPKSKKGKRKVSLLVEVALTIQTNSARKPVRGCVGELRGTRPSQSRSRRGVSSNEFVRIGVGNRQRNREDIRGEVEKEASWGKDFPLASHRDQGQRTQKGKILRRQDREEQDYPSEGGAVPDYA